MLFPAMVAATTLVAATLTGTPPSELRHDVEALRATGVTGVLARLETPAGQRVVRSGPAVVAIAMSHPRGDTAWSYSNTNYVLAGLLIEAVTGRTWAREVEARIIGPLGLRHTRAGFVRDLPAVAR